MGFSLPTASRPIGYKKIEHGFSQTFLSYFGLSLFSKPINSMGLLAVGKLKPMAKTKFQTISNHSINRTKKYSSGFFVKKAQFFLLINKMH